MKFYMVKDKESLSQKAYECMVEVIHSSNEVTLGLATGGSPKRIYELFRQHKPNTEHVTTINLDEYIGLAPTHEKSYRYFMNEQLFNHLPFKETFVPDGASADNELACTEYDEIIKKHPIDLQLLGIGENGHIAFNEPGDSFEHLTHVVDLTESTINANSRYFEKREDVPTQAISMGIASIMKAKQILLIAYGVSKAEAIKSLVEMPVSEDCPATALREHPNVTIIADEDACSLLSDVNKEKFLTTN